MFDKLILLWLWNVNFKNYKSAQLEYYKYRKGKILKKKNNDIILVTLKLIIYKIYHINESSLILLLLNCNFGKLRIAEIKGGFFYAISN